MIEGHLTFRFRPSRPHCGCCVLDLIELRTTLEAQPKVMSVTITVEDVPDAALVTRHQRSPRLKRRRDDARPIALQGD